MKRSTDTDVDFSRLVEVEKIPATGSYEKLEADAQERARLADMLGLEKIASLTAELTVTPWRKQGFKVAGTSRAEITQTCVVTLDAFDSVIQEPVERYYLRGNAPGHTDKVVTIDPLEDDDAELLEGNTIDVGEVVREGLALALDPYPRKPGANFDDIARDSADDEEDSPFALLKKITPPN